jgi:hypothetical protein
MAQQTSVETIEEQIDFEIKKLEMDFNSGVEWSMRIMYKSLQSIKQKAEQADEMHEAEVKYSEAEVLKLLLQFHKDKPLIVFDASEWFEQFKKK